MRNKNYNLTEAMKFLGIGRDQLFYWINRKRLIKPAVQGVGRGGRTRLSFQNTIYLAVIKELLDFGLELNTIKEILRETDKLFSTIKENRKKHEDDKFVIILDKEKKTKKFSVSFLPTEDFILQVYDDLSHPIWEGEYAPWSILIINIYGIITKLEEEIGAKL
jgi:DNA-binding transcriptional MerR regulator